MLFANQNLFFFFAPLFGSSHWTKQIIGINNIFQNIHKYRKTMDIQ